MANQIIIKSLSNLGTEFKSFASFYFNAPIVRKSGRTGKNYKTKPIASGKTLKSIEKKVYYDASENAYYLTILADKSWYGSNYGSPAGTNVSIKDLLDWARAKGIVKQTNKTALGFLKALQAKIKEKGTDKPPALWFEKTVKKVEENFNKTELPKIQSAISGEIESTFDKFAKDL